MKKYILLAITISLLVTYNAKSQTRGIKIGYIDMEYILEKVPDYAEAKNQLDQKAEKWKQEIQTKKTHQKISHKTLFWPEHVNFKRRRVKSLTNPFHRTMARQIFPQSHLHTMSIVINGAAKM